MPAPFPLDASVWLADLTHTGRGTATDTTPLGIGLLGAYLGTQCALPEPVRLFRYPQRLAEALRRHGPPDVIGFAAYVWNTTLSRAFARAIKRHAPRTVVVFGGPNFPLRAADQRAWLGAAPEVDFFVDREGEAAFADLLRRLAVAGWDTGQVHGAAPSTMSVDVAGQLRAGPPAPRLRDLSAIPSPYLNGSMDEFLDGRLVPTIQTNRGCPFSCSFCLEGAGYYSRVNFFPADRIVGELDYLAERMVGVVAGGGRNELMITDSNFGMFAPDAEICAAIGRANERYGWPAQVNVTTGKNRRDRVLAAVGRANGTIEVSGAVQSLDRTVLENINRATIDTADLIAVAQQANSSRTRTYSDVILGLPGDTVESHIATVATLIDGGFGRVNTFQFALLDGAEVNTPEVRDRFGMRTMFRVLPRDFGRYDVLGDSLVCAEVDEICVSSDSLTFEEYLDCRAFDLTTFLFHNDAIFGTAEAALRLAGVPPGGWISAIHRLARWPGRLAELRRDYLRDTRDQLFDTATQAHGDVGRQLPAYLNGTRGNNLLYSYRARALTDAVDDLADAALRGLDDLPRPRAGRHLDWQLVGQAVEFDRLRLGGVPELAAARPSRPVEGRFDFDFLRLLTDPDARSAAELRWQPARAVRFELPAGGQRLVGTYRSVMGTTADGIGRALTRVPVERFKRVPVYAAADDRPG
ncbi:MAG TPA: radical SAM protein [Mycobacteriales bacterium]|nr:radical SAM protein [Mycobacteriales bacterium]